MSPIIMASSFFGLAAIGFGIGILVLAWREYYRDKKLVVSCSGRVEEGRALKLSTDISDFNYVHGLTERRLAYYKEAHIKADDSNIFSLYALQNKASIERLLSAMPLGKVLEKDVFELVRTEEVLLRFSSIPYDNPNREILEAIIDIANIVSDLSSIILDEHAGVDAVSREIEKLSEIRLFLEEVIASKKEK